MEVRQIYEIMNDVTSEILGETELTLNEDLSNIVEIGNEILNVNDVDNYVRSLTDHISKVIFVNRPYSGSVPSVMMDSWEFGSVMEKITAEMPKATENESWELADGESYDPNIFYKPNVSVKFYNKRVTFEIPMSFTEKQVKSSFSSASQLNGFMSMLYNAVDKALTVKIDSLIMRTINNMIAETVYSDYNGADITEATGIKAVNLLYLYNTEHGTQLTADKAVTDKEFIRYAAYKIGLYSSRMSKISTLFNIGGKDRFTPKDLQHIVMLTEFGKAADVYLQSDVFHNEFTALPKAELVPYWQGSGKEYAFADTSKISVKTASNNNVTVTGVLAVIFDRDALGVSNLDRRVTSNYNPKAEFYNNWYKFDAGYYNDFNENAVVFFVA